MGSQGNGLEFSLPVRVDFGVGRIGILAEQLEQSGFNRAVFVITPGRYRSGMLAPSISSLKKRGIETAIFDRVEENPDVETVNNCVRFLQAHAPQVVIGVGGGSPLDTSKAAAICYANGIDNVLKLLNSTKLQKKTVPTIMVPTTSGTGSETNYWAVISNPQTREKLSIGHPAMSPYMTIVDPELTLSLPRGLTLYTGIDALTHALEAYISSSSNRLSDLLALEAIKLVSESLDRAVNHGEDLGAREQMSLASLLAGLAMQQAGLGLIHAMSHQISGFYNTPHGLTNAKLLGTVFSYSLPYIREDKRKRLDSLTERGFQMLIDKIVDLQGGDADTISIKQSDLKLMVERAAKNVNAVTNPRKAKSQEIVFLYREAFVVES